MLLSNTLTIMPMRQGQTVTYSRFLQQANQHFDKVQASHPSEFSCKQGCHACCEPGLTVLKIEANNIATFIKEHPEVQTQLKNIDAENPHRGTRCSMLNKDGQCAIYPVRPFICRSHGAPIAIAREEYFQIDVCPLNFVDKPIEELGPESFFILDDWNGQLLDLADMLEPSSTRIPLTLEALQSLSSYSTSEDDKDHAHN